MADSVTNAFEIERRGIMWTPLITLNDGVTSLGYDGDPNNVIDGNTPGESWLYSLPTGQFYKQSDATLWWKSEAPNTWINLSEGGGGGGEGEPAYTKTFNTNDWTEISPTEFEMSIGAVTHQQGSIKELHASIFENGTPNEALITSYTVSDNGTVKFYSESTFNGYLIISNLSGGGGGGDGAFIASSDTYDNYDLTEQNAIPNYKLDRPFEPEDNVTGGRLDIVDDIKALYGKKIKVYTDDPHTPDLYMDVDFEQPVSLSKLRRVRATLENNSTQDFHFSVSTRYADLNETLFIKTVPPGEIVVIDEIIDTQGLEWGPPSFRISLTASVYSAWAEWYVSNLLWQPVNVKDFLNHITPNVFQSENITIGSPEERELDLGARSVSCNVSLDNATLILPDPTGTNTYIRRIVCRDESSKSIFITVPPSAVLYDTNAIPIASNVYEVKPGEIVLIGNRSNSYSWYILSKIKPSPFDIAEEINSTPFFKPNGDLPVNVPKKIKKYTISVHHDDLSARSTWRFIKTDFWMLANPEFVRIGVYLISNDTLIEWLDYDTQWNWDYTSSGNGTPYVSGQGSLKVGVEIKQEGLYNSDYYYKLEYYEVELEQKFSIRLDRGASTQNTSNTKPPRMFWRNTTPAGMFKMRSVVDTFVDANISSITIQYSRQGTFLNLTYTCPNRFRITELLDGQYDGNNLPTGWVLEIYKSRLSNKMASAAGYKSAASSMSPIRVTNNKALFSFNSFRIRSSGLPSVQFSKTSISPAGEHYFKLRNINTNEVIKFNCKLILMPITLKQVDRHNTSPAQYPNKFLGRISVPIVEKIE